MDKFLLARNPMRRDASDVFIIHMLNPMAILQCTPGHVEPKEQYYQHCQFRNKLGEMVEITISLYHISHNAEPEATILHLMERAWRWYRSYLEQSTPNNNYQTGRK